MPWNTANTVLSGLTFFYTQPLKRPGIAPAMPARRTPHRRPDIDSAEELQRLFAAPAGKPRAAPMATHGGGLRAGGVVRLQVTDIDSQRRMLRAARGKRHKGRYTLLSERRLAGLRAYWLIDRPRPWLFPGRGPRRPMTDDMARLFFNQAKAKAGLHKRGRIHALRHRFATHLLEARVDLRTIQILMGRASITATAYSLQLTRKPLGRTQHPLDLLDWSSRSAFEEAPPCQPS